MHAIRDAFVRSIGTTMSNAVGTSVVLNLGINAHKSSAQQTPNAQLLVGAGPPGQAGSRAVQFAPTHGNIQTLLQSNRNVLYELYLTELIQHWFDFLGELYKNAVDQKLSCNAPYSIPKIKVLLDFDKASTNLRAHILETACEKFDFLAADDKLRVVQKSLKVDLTNVQTDVRQIKVNIAVRNILQHNLGIVSTDHLQALDARSIEVDQGNGKVQITTGQRVPRSAFDLENLVFSFAKVASALVP